MPAIHPLLPTVMAALALAWVACGADAPPPSSLERAVRVVAVPDPENVPTPSYPGRAEAGDEIDLGFEVDGRMLERPVSVGDRVQAGQVLAQLDLRDFRAAVERATALRDQSAARLTRVRAAARTGAVAQQDLTDATARAREAAAKLAIRQKDLEDASLRAPFTGTIAATYAEVNQEIRAREPVLRLLDASTVKLWVQVPEDRIDLVPDVESISVRFDALPGREFSATIGEIGAEADDQTRTYPVSLVIDQGESMEIRPGMAGEATPSGVRRAGIELPLSAVFSDTTAGTYAWVLNDDGQTVSRRAIEAGALTNSGIVLLGGLEPGEKIIVGGGRFLSEGSRVRVLEDGGAGS